MFSLNSHQLHILFIFKCRFQVLQMCWLGLREGISTVTPGSFAMLCLLGTELQNILSFSNAQEGGFGCFVIHLTFYWLKIKLWLSDHVIWIKVGKTAWLLVPLVHDENLCINVVHCWICTHGPLYLIFYIFMFLQPDQTT